MRFKGKDPREVSAALAAASRALGALEPPDTVDVADDAVFDLADAWLALQEGTWDPRLHPRDPLGRFARLNIGGLELPDDPADLTDEQKESIIGELAKRIGGMTAPAPSPSHDALKPVTFSPQVARIEGRADAEEYFRSIGLDARLDGLDDPRNANALRQVAQAVTDALARFPSLKDGTVGRLAGIAAGSAVTFDDNTEEGFKTGGVWGMTAVGPGSRRFDLGGYDVPELQQFSKWHELAEQEGGIGGGGSDTWVYLNDGFDEEVPDEFGGGREVWRDDSVSAGHGNAWADKTVYGRMTHELGHAVAQTSGLDFELVDDGGVDMPRVITFFEQSGLLPEEMFSISRYAQASDSEAWAEVFATLNVPGALDGYTDEIIAKLKRLRELANADGRKLL